MQKKNLENIISEATGFSSKPRNASYRVGRIKKKKEKKKTRSAATLAEHLLLALSSLGHFSLPLNGRRVYTLWPLIK